MSDINDIMKVDAQLNELLQATITRIRRCVTVKRVACERMRSDDVEVRKNGFDHCRSIIAIQKDTYPNFLIRLRDFIDLREKIAALQPLEKGYLSLWRFNHAKKTLTDTLATLSDCFTSIIEKADIIYKLVFAQAKLLQTTLFGDEEAQLRDLLTMEFEESEDLIKKLNSALELAVRSVRSMNLFRVRLFKFLIKCKKHRLGNVMDDSQAFCETVEQYLSAFYAFKSYLQLVGMSLGFFAPVKELRTVGLVLAGGIFGLDYVTDFLAGLPETRRVIKRWRGELDEEERRQKERRAAILVSLGVKQDPLDVG